MKRPLAVALAAVALAVLAAACSKPSEGSPAVATGTDTPVTAAEGRRVEITASNEGYTPSTIEAKAGESLVLRFTRTTKSECLSQVVFPDLKITKDLPLNTPVEVAIKADKPGKIPFQCGMAMVKGAVHVSGS
jgi:plastocyanin domain-containing protein